MKAALKLNGVIYEVEITDEQAKQIEETNEKFVLTENEMNAVLKSLDERLGNIDEVKEKMRAAYAIVEKAKAADEDYEFSAEEIKLIFGALSTCGYSIFTQKSSDPYLKDETAQTVQNVVAKLSRIMMKRMGLGSWGPAIGLAFNGGGCAT